MLISDQKQTLSELLQALALRLGRNVLLLEASLDLRLSLNFVSIFFQTDGPDIVKTGASR